MLLLNRRKKKYPFPKFRNEEKFPHPNLGQFNAHKFRLIILNKHPLERRITRP